MCRANWNSLQGSLPNAWTSLCDALTSFNKSIRRCNRSEKMEKHNNSLKSAKQNAGKWILHKECMRVTRCSLGIYVIMIQIVCISWTDDARMADAMRSCSCTFIFVQHSCDVSQSVPSRTMHVLQHKLPPWGQSSSLNWTNILILLLSGRGAKSVNEFTAHHLPFRYQAFMRLFTQFKIPICRICTFLALVPPAVSINQSNTNVVFKGIVRILDKFH